MSGRFVGLLVMTMTHGKTTPMSRSEIMAGTDTRPDQGHARCNTLTDCRCGQQLDMCARAHCPRCGRSITQP
jgi:hypothetical protein